MSRPEAIRLFVLNGCSDAEIVEFLCANVEEVRKIRGEMGRDRASGEG